MKPDLCDSLGEAGDLSDALQVLAVRVGINLEVGLEDLDLLLRERRSHSLRLLLGLRLRVATLCCNHIKGKTTS